MKTYQSNYNEQPNKEGNFFTRNLFAILLGATVITLAAVVTLSLLFGNPSGNYIDEDGKNASLTPKFVMPVANYELGQTAILTKLVYTSTLNQWRTHNGVDFLTAAGEEVCAVTDGTVSKIENTLTEGTVVTISHADGLISVYKSLNEDVTVSQGDVIKGGMVIGTVAEIMPTEAHIGTHLHLEMRQNNKLVDPMKYLNPQD